MQVSSMQIRDSTPFDDFQDLEQTDGGVIGLENGNGHLSALQSGTTNQTKANSQCCS